MLLPGRGDQAQGKAVDAGDASIAEAGGRLPVRHACLPAGRQAWRTQTGCMTPAQAGRIGQESREML